MFVTLGTKIKNNLVSWDFFEDNLYFYLQKTKKYKPMSEFDGYPDEQILSEVTEKETDKKCPQPWCHPHLAILIGAGICVGLYYLLR